MIERLVDLLRAIQFRAARDFSGVGLIVSDAPELSPIVPIRPRSMGNFGQSTIDTLVEISSSNNKFHDGFHVLSSNFEMLLVAQYFSPPILQQSTIDRRRRFGGPLPRRDVWLGNSRSAGERYRKQRMRYSRVSKWC